MKKYRKLIAALVGLAILAAARHGFDLSEHTQAITDLVVSGLTAISIYYFPNDKGES